LHLVDEVRVKEQVLQVGILIEGFFNVAQELRSDDATTSPHQGDTSVVQVPVEFLGLSLLITILAYVLNLERSFTPIN